MNITIPDRVSVQEASPHYSPLAVRIECKLDGVVQRNAVEACISEGWVKRLSVDADGKLIVRLGEVQSEVVKGRVELTLQAARKK